MNVGQIKIRILVIRSIDWSVLLAVFALGGYAVLYSEQATLMGAATLVGLFFVNKLGNFSTTKIKGLQVQLKRLLHEQKILERRRQ